MCGHSLSLQDFNSNKMQRNTMFLNTTTSAVQYPPTLSAFRIHEVIVLLAEKSAADLSRYRKTRCAAARWYTFEDKGDYIDIYGGFYTCVSMGMSASIHLGGDHTDAETDIDIDMQTDTDADARTDTRYRYRK